jgi:uncharacterized caspase-like protein
MRFYVFFFWLFLVFAVSGPLAQEPRLVLPVGHLGGITNLDVSPNKSLFLTEDLNSDIILIDSRGLIELQRYNFENKKIKSSCFLSDSIIVAVEEDSVIILINILNNKISEINSGKQWNKLKNYNGDIYGIDIKGSIYKINLKKNQDLIESITSLLGNDFIIMNNSEIIVIDKNTISIQNLNSKSFIKKKFDEEITTISCNKNSILLGFEHGDILELNKELNLKHNFVKMSDRISCLIYINDSIIVSGSYDYSIAVQTFDRIINSTYLDDWVVDISISGKNITVASWSGMINTYNLDNDFLFEKSFDCKLKKSTFFCQKDSLLYTSYNDGSVRKFNLKTNTLIFEYDITNNQILGIDINKNNNKILIWTENEILLYDLNLQKIENKHIRNNIFSAIFIPNSESYVFVNDKFMFRVIRNTLDSVEIKNSWSITHFDQEKVEVSGLDKVLLINENHIQTNLLKNLGTVRICKKLDEERMVLGISDGTIVISSITGKIIKKKKLAKGILEIEIIDKENMLVLSEDGEIRKYDYIKNEFLSLTSSQEYGSWDFLYNKKTDNIIFPNTKIWSYQMGIDVINFENKIFENKIDNLGGQVICVSNSNKSIDFNGLDSNEVIYIVSDGTVRKLNTAYDAQEYISKIGFDYFNFLSLKIDNSILNSVKLKSGLLNMSFNNGAQLTYINLRNNDWLVYDEHYRYDGTQGARDYLYFVCGLEVVDLAQVKDALYVPTLVQRIMNGENLDHLPKLKDLEICGVSPEVEPIENKKDGGNYYKITPRKGGLGNIEIFINGALRQTIDSKKLKLQNGIYEFIVDEKLIQQFETAAKETEIKVIAKTADNKISSRGVISESVTEVQKTYRKPHLHAVLVGIDDYKGEGLDLNYAAKDAIDLQKALETSSKKLFNIDDTNRVHFYNLSVDRTGKISGLTPDRNNILQAIEKIAVESKPEDVMLIFFAGHGEINKNKQLILLTADASKEQAPDYSGITIKELLEKLTTVPAGKRILLLDACHSGAAINELNLKEIAGVRNGEVAEKQTQRFKELENLASKSGLSIITASSSDQKAMELPQYEHGLMTYALLTTMMNEPNVLDKDNNLQIEDWLRETERAVSRLIENQSAQRFVPINFSIGKVDEEVRKSVDLKEIPTIVIANVFNRDTDDDELEVKSQLKKLLNENATRGTNKILISEKESSNTISVIVSYEIVEGKIESRITLKKNKVVIKQFNFAGTLSDVPGFVKGLGEEIIKNIRL